MKKVIALILMCLLFPVAQAAINPATGVDFAVENNADAIDILSHKTRKARIAAAVNYFIDVVYKGECNQTKEGEPYRMETAEADGVVTVMCHDQELVQMEVKEGSTFSEIKERALGEGGDFGDWGTLRAATELVLFWPQLTNLKDIH